MIAAAVLVLSLGLDTLAVAFGLGLTGLPRARWLRLGLTLALFEGLMPVAGLLAGQRLGGVLGEVATYAAGALLVLIGGLGIREAWIEAASGSPRPAEAEAKEERPLLLTGLSVGLDELAIGLSLGILGVPLGPALAYVAVQAFALTFVGLHLGQRLGGRLGQRAELAAGVALVLVGVVLIANEATGAHVL